MTIKQERELRAQADNGNLEGIRDSIAAGVNPSAADLEGFTPLHYAMNSYPHLPHKEHLATVQLLVESGADIHASSREGQTPLHNAAAAGLSSVVRYLHQGGAEIDTSLSGGDNVLFAIADHLENRPLNYQVTIIRDGRRVTLTDRDEIRAEIGSHPDDEVDEYMEIVQYLIDNGISLDRCAIDSGQTPLFSAAGAGSDGMVQIILAQAGIDLNIRDKWGLAPLHYASRHGHERAVQLLLEAGADPNSAESYGFTPLHEAAENGRLDVARLLVQHGADIDPGLVKSYAPYQLGDTPLHIARAKGETELAEFLEQERHAGDRQILEKIIAALGRIGSELSAEDHMRDYDPWLPISRQEESIRALLSGLSASFRQQHASLVQTMATSPNMLYLDWWGLRDRLNELFDSPGQ